MKQYFIAFSLILICLGIVPCASAQGNSGKTFNHTGRLLVSSGGGARGAWGVGMAEDLMEFNHAGYDAVFGTSTGSLMASLILLKDTEKLRKLYCNIQNGTIFSIDPFNTDSNRGKVTTNPNIPIWLWRLYTGKPTLGESESLYNLITTNLDSLAYDSISKLRLCLAVAVTNFADGNLSMEYSDSNGYSNMCKWIWASANEPLYMSYVDMVKKCQHGYYVDGGVVDVIPLMEALDYAIDSGLTDIDVIVNNSAYSLSPFNPNADGWFAGLERVLDVYGQSTLTKDVQLGQMFADNYQMHDSILMLEDSINKILSPKGDRVYKKRDKEVEKRSSIHLNVYYMPNDLAMIYQDELGFYRNFMERLYTSGRHTVIKPSTEAELKDKTRAKVYQFSINKETYKKFRRNRAK